MPSTLDVYANSSSIFHGESKVGDFNVFNLPVITGRGDLVVKTQDITGKIQTVTIPYYVAPVLLTKGYNGLKNLNKKIVRFAWKEVRIEKIT